MCPKSARAEEGYEHTMKLLTERITALGGLGGTQERTSTYAAWLSTVSERASGRGGEGRPLAYAAWLSTVSERVLPFRANLLRAAAFAA